MANYVNPGASNMPHAGQSAPQKPADFNAIVKINSIIAEEEKKINNAYLQIGKLYVTNHAEDYEESFGELVTTVKDAEDAIKRGKKQIQNIKGIIECEKCGKEMDNTQFFCSICGTPLPRPEPILVEEEEEEVKANLCAKCGSPVPEGMLFCTNCGEKQVVARKCPNCNAEVGQSLNFCTECGTKL